MTEVAAAVDLDRPVPAGLPPDHPQFAAHRRAHIDPNVVARIRHGRVLDHYAAVTTEDDTLLFDLSPYYGVRRASQHPVFLRVRPPEVRNVAGSVAVLNTRGTDNYYHWLTDVLPRLELLRRAGAEPDAYLVNRRTRFQCDMLDHLGISADRCLDHPHLRADELIVPSLPDDNLKTPPFVVPWLRSQFLPGDIGAPHRRLYVGRGQKKHTRRLENEAELLDALEPFGFEAVDPGAMAPAEQVRCFAEAECVVGVHGAGRRTSPSHPPGRAWSSSSRPTTSTSASGLWPPRWTVCATATSSATARRPGPGGSAGGLRRHGRPPAGRAPPRRVPLSVLQPGLQNKFRAAVSLLL